MALELQFQQRQILALKLVITPQLQQAIKLLQLNRLELTSAVRQEMLENPTLEESIDQQPEPEVVLASAPPPEKEQTAESEVPRNAEQDINWRDYLNQNYTSDFYAGAREKEEDGDKRSLESLLTRKGTLADHLMWQLRLGVFSHEDERIAAEIIGNLNEDGYLMKADAEIHPDPKDPLVEIAEKLGADLARVGAVQRRIQEFDPVGVAARDLSECLLAQIRVFLPQTPHLHDLVANHLPHLERRNYKAISRAMGITIEEVIVATKCLQTLNPRPGRTYGGEEPRYITPDIYVHKVGDQFVVLLNDDGLPKLRINSFYRRMLNDRAAGSKEAREYIQEKLKSAAWLIKSIHQRQRTIFRVTESIVKFQQDFLEHGVGQLKPLILKDVAEDVGMHESTISRVTRDKYVHTPQGIFELKYFFNTSISRLDGEEIASESVKEKIRQFVAAENGDQPLSDQRIMEMLKRESIDIARRTVTKYREMLGILSSGKRKKPY